MKVTDEHRQEIAKKIENLSTKQLREEMVSKGLTKSQAGSSIKNTRKRLKIYKKENGK